MKYIKPISAILLALPLIIFGSNYFLHLFPLPPGDGSIGSELLQMLRDGGLMTYVALSHVVIGILLLVPRTRTLGALLQLPITLGMVAFHATMLPAGLGLVLFFLLLNIAVLADKGKVLQLVENQ